MNIVSLLDLFDQDYSLSNVCVLRQFWRDRKSFQCIGNPKTNDILLYLDGCKAEYTTKDGQIVLARSGEIVYCPLGSEYTVRFYDFETDDSNTVGVNFLLHDLEGKPFIFTEKIAVFPTENASYKSMFYKMVHYSQMPLICAGKLKSILYNLIFHLCEQRKQIHFDKYRIIAKGISYLEEDERQLMSIQEVAAMCNVSEAYFRRMFKAYSGMSPQAYRTSSKITRAKAYLKHGELSISEITEMLGFTDTAYFTKQFHKLVGCTPHEYRNLNS